MSNPVEDWFCNEYLAGTAWIPYKFKSPNRRGVPDRLFIGPEGRHFFIEFKGENEAIRPEQKRNIRYLIENQHAVYVVRKRDEAVEIFTHHDTGTRHFKLLKQTCICVMDSYGEGQDGNSPVSN